MELTEEVLTKQNNDLKNINNELKTKWEKEGIWGSMEGWFLDYKYQFDRREKYYSKYYPINERTEKQNLFIINEKIHCKNNVMLLRFCNNNYRDFYEEGFSRFCDRYRNK